MSTAHRPAAADPPATEDEDTRGEREAARLRRDHRSWVIIWLAPAPEFRAYRRLPGARRDTALAAGTADGLAVQIGHAEQNTPPRSQEDRA